jgi:hypothetical protein
MKGMLLIFALVFTYVFPFIGIPLWIIWALVRFRKLLAKLILSLG